MNPLTLEPQRRYRAPSPLPQPTPTSHKHQASKFHFVWLMCPHSHPATFPGLRISIPYRVSSFRITKRSYPVKGSPILLLELLKSSGQPQKHFPATSIAHRRCLQPHPGILSLRKLIYLFTSPNPFPAAQAGTWAHTH